MRSIVFIFLFFLTTVIHADDVVSTYVDEGLKSNLALKQKAITLEQSLQVLREARGMFYPSFNIEARYSRAGGGRDIDIPIGDVINPMHQTLNQLLGQAVFPGNLANEHIPFLRKEEHDTKLRIVQPLFQPGIYYHNKIQHNRTHIQQAEHDILVRELVRDIKVAYFNHLKAVNLVVLLDSTQILLEENLRVSQKRVDADKATRDVVYRARAELADLMRQQTEARRDSTLSAAYFNFLLNRPQNTAIQIQDFNALNTPVETPILETLQQNALTRRDEFRQLQLAVHLARNAVSLSRAANLPNVHFVYDYGFEGETYTFDGHHDYWMASVVMKWNLFDGFQKQARIKQRELEQQKMEIRHTELEQQIALQVHRAHENMHVAIHSVQAAQQSAESAYQSFRIICRQYEEGVVPHIAFLDARTTYTRAKIQHVIALFDVHIQQAELERIAALYPIENDASKE